MRAKWVWSVGLVLVAGSVQQISAQDHVNTAQPGSTPVPFVVARGGSRSDGAGDIKVKVSGADTGGAVAVLGCA